MTANERLTLEEVEKYQDMKHPDTHVEINGKMVGADDICDQLIDLMRENERLRTLVGDKLPQDLWPDERCEAEALRQKQEERITKMMNTNPAKDE